MRSLKLPLFILFIAGCEIGCEPRAECDGYGCDYDIGSPSGVRFRNLPPTVAYGEGELEHMIVSPYKQVEICAQILTGGPLIIVVADGTDLRDGRVGVTYNDGVIVITATSVQDGWQTPSSVLRHEYVHYLLHASGFPNDLNRTHASPLFAQCAGF